MEIQAHSGMDIQAHTGMEIQAHAGMEASETGIMTQWMAFRGIQEYIARDANNIARVEDEGHIVSIKGNIFLYPPKKSHPILLLLFT